MMWFALLNRRLTKRIYINMYRKKIILYNVNMKEEIYIWVYDIHEHTRYTYVKSALTHCDNTLTSTCSTLASRNKINSKLFRTRKCAWVCEKPNKCLKKKYVYIYIFIYTLYIYIHTHTKMRLINEEINKYIMQPVSRCSRSTGYIWDSVEKRQQFN